MPSAELLSHISTFNATSSLASSALSSIAAPTTLSWSVSDSAQGSSGADTTFTTQWAALLSGVSQQQAGASPLYFKPPRKIQIFGICCDSNRKQHNYLIDEDNSISTNGANTHGPNAVISMLDRYFHTHYETRCHLHCDNCVGQNKNICYWIFSMANYNWKTSGDHTIISACRTYMYTLPCRRPFWVDKEDLPPI